jgi:outer membrane protein OmpA-like peptidoglycan-associated protein
MKKLILGAGLAALAMTGIADAGNPKYETKKYPSKEETIGLVGGAAIGAAAGGPPGAFVGLALGAWLGDHANNQKVKIAGLKRELTDSKAEIVALNLKLGEADASIAQLASDLKLTNERLTVAQAGLPSMPPAMQRTLHGEVLFRTNESALRSDTGSQLASLAEVLASTPGAVVQLDAYADPRGSDAENLKLTERRAAAVREALVAGGLSPDRITMASHGEEGASSVKGDVDGYAFDRRVVITINSAEARVAQSGDTARTEATPPTP